MGSIDRRTPPYPAEEIGISTALARGLLIATLVVVTVVQRPVAVVADGDVERRIADFWARVDGMQPNDHLAAVDLGKWALNVIERDPSARISLADFHHSTASMQAGLDRAGPDAGPATPFSSAVEARVAEFWQRINAMRPTDHLAAADLGQWALNVIERDSRARIMVSDFRASTAGMQSAMTRAAEAARPLVLTVSNTGDLINGAVSSAGALVADPGPDGISLREAITAANATAGPNAIYILFAPELAQRTIALQTWLPRITRDALTIQGPISDSGEPLITVDASGGEGLQDWYTTVLLIQASRVTVRGLRFTGLDWVGKAYMLVIAPGELAPHYGAGPASVRHVRVEDNVFDNSGITNPTALPGRETKSANGLMLWTGPNNLPSAAPHIANVVVARNRFVHMTGNAHAVGLVVGGNGSVAEDFVVRDNTFLDNELGVEVSAVNGSGNRLSRVSILSNRFSGGAIALPISATNTVVEDTRIAGNVIACRCRGPLHINPGNDELGTPTGNVIRNTQIVNNMIDAGGDIAVEIIGGNGPAVGNRVDGVDIVNSTIVGSTLVPPIAVYYDMPPSASGPYRNSVVGVSVRNSIIWSPGRSFDGTVSRSAIRSSIVSSDFAGANGNISADPGFVDPPHSYALRSGSPAIGAGTGESAPATDIEGRPRPAGNVDMGAYQSGTARERLTLSLDEFGGTGSVISSPAGISCASICSAAFDQNTRVTLTASAAPGARFTGWSGACSGTGSCVVALGGAKFVRARFAQE